MKRIYFILVALLAIYNVQAQKETNIWYFGVNSGLNFNTLITATADDASSVSNMPTPITGPINTHEGCFTLSTFDGNLLFSSDGLTVYDKNGNTMDNGTGLNGGGSSAQSGIVVPKPGSLIEYYIITTPENPQPKGVCYSVVDISANGGLGKVTSKNNVIKAGSTGENLVVVLQSNEEDYWLIHRTDKTFYVYAITESGINSTPVFTITHPSIVTTSKIGATLLSPDHKKLISTTWPNTQLISAEFDVTTGTISNLQISTFPSTPYSGDFSSDSEHVYIGNGATSGAWGRMYHSTWTNLRSGGGWTTLYYGMSNVRRAMDGRLYGTQGGYNAGTWTRNLHVIMNPDAGGTDIKHFTNYLINPSWWGLPSFASGFVRLIAKEQPFSCISHSRTYNVDINNAGGNIPARLEWDFGDGTPIVTQTVTMPNTKYSTPHTYNSLGTFTITITPYKADNTKLKPVTVKSVVVNCTLKTNRMTRSELQNAR